VGARLKRTTTPAMMKRRPSRTPAMVAAVFMIEGSVECFWLKERIQFLCGGHAAITRCAMGILGSGLVSMSN
jgi:hypothetical protein